MKLTLTTEEIKTAIKLYLRANAAVEVSDMDFSAKREGVIAEVDAEFIELNVEPVAPIEVPVAVPEAAVEHEPVEITEHEADVLQESYKANPEELVDATNIMRPQDGERTYKGPSIQVTDEDIESIEAAIVDTDDDLPFDLPTETQLELNFEQDEPEEEEQVTTEEMPVQNSVSIADILGS